MPLGEQFDEILAAAQTGAPWALEALYREFHPGILAFMRARAGGEAEDLAEDPQIIANRYLIEYDHPDLGRQLVPGPPAQLSATPAAIRMPAPYLGQHTEEILTEVCGYSWDDVAEFRALGAVG